MNLELGIGLVLGSIMLTLALHKAIIKLLYWASIAALSFMLMRGIVFVASYQAALTPLIGGIIGGILGFIVVGVICAAYIRHMLIHFYLKQSIDKSKQAAKAGRLW